LRAGHRAPPGLEGPGARQEPEHLDPRTARAQRTRLVAPGLGQRAPEGPVISGTSRVVPSSSSSCSALTTATPCRAWSPRTFLEVLMSALSSVLPILTTASVVPA